MQKKKTSSYLASFQTRKLISSGPPSLLRTHHTPPTPISYSQEWMISHAEVKDGTLPSDCFEFVIQNISKYLELSYKSALELIAGESNFGELYENSNYQPKIKQWLQGLLDSAGLMVNLVCKDVNSVAFVLDLLVPGMKTEERHIVVRTCKLITILVEGFALTSAVMSASWEWYVCCCGSGALCIVFWYTRYHQQVVLLVACVLNVIVGL